MHNQKIIMRLLISSILAAMLGGCSGNIPPPSQTDTKLPSSTASLETESSDLDKNGAAVLYIGNPDHLQEVSVQDAATAEELIVAIAKETGWNLSLAQTPAAGELQDTLKIALTADSAIYNAPPEQQKDSYHVFDSEDYVLTVLNSVSETLCRNLNLGGVYFTSPDGGVLTLKNGDYSFCFSNIYCWDYYFAKECNEPLSEDEIGDVFVNPNQGPILEGPNTLKIVFKRQNVQPMAGTLTIYNEDGSVWETISMNDSSRMRTVEVSEYERNYYNLKEGEGTSFHFFPAKKFEAGKEYSVSVSEGAFTAEGGLKTMEIIKDTWFFHCIDMGLTVTPELGHEPVIKIGEPITYHFKFSDDVKRVYVQVPDGDIDYSYSVEELTSDGDIVFTPNKLGKTSWEISVELKDGSIIGFTETSTVVEEGL